MLARISEDNTPRQLFFELRNGPAPDAKIVDKVSGAWTELSPQSSRLVKREYGDKLDAERIRKREVIIDLLYHESMEGRMYNARQFCEAFENKRGLGAVTTISDRLSVLATTGHVKYLQDYAAYGLPKPARTRQGYLCVQDMVLPTGEEAFHPYTGEIEDGMRAVDPTHYKHPEHGNIVECEDAIQWPVELPD